MNENSKMAELLAEAAESAPLNSGDMVEGKIIYLGKDNCLVDLGTHGTGIINGRELTEAQNMTVAQGDPIQAAVIEPENADGYIVLSLRRASREKIWDQLEDYMRGGQVLDIRPFDANKGGLLIEFEGIKGFLPVSQLSAENYPRVQGGDKEEIFQRLKSLTGQILRARVLDVDRREAKLIFSEKEALREKTREILEKLKIGEKTKGVVTGIVDFGIFVNVQGIEGLIHISEIDWDRVLSPRDYVEVGQEVEALIISVDGDKVSLSLKRLKEDPWLAEIEQYKEGQDVEGTITRVTPFGVFVDLGKIEALAHVSELSEVEGGEPIKPAEIFEAGEAHPFKVLLIEPEARKIFLTKKGVAGKAVRPKKSAKKTVKKEEKKKS